MGQDSGCHLPHGHQVIALRLLEVMSGQCDPTAAQEQAPDPSRANNPGELGLTGSGKIWLFSQSGNMNSELLVGLCSAR